VTPSEIISEVRQLVQDTRTPYRYNDTTLLGFVNQTLKRIVIVRPDLFSKYGEIPTTAGETLQTLPADSTRLVEIFQVKGGNTVTEVVREIFDQTFPAWANAEAGTPVNYMRHIRNPNRFFLYPKPAEGVVLMGEYIQSPKRYGADETIELLSESYFSTVIDGVVFLAESVDNEHVNSGRADMYQKAFYNGLVTSLQSRAITDTETSTVEGTRG
jgi:hypothetical protein